MANATSITGFEVHLGPATETDQTATEYAALSYEKLNKVTSNGEIGNEDEIVSEQPLQGHKISVKGPKNAKAFELTLIKIAEDASQAALFSAGESNSNYAIKLVDPDAPEGKTPTTYYVRGLVSGVLSPKGGASNMDMLKTMITPNSLFIKVDPVTI